MKCVIIGLPVCCVQFVISAVQLLELFKWRGEEQAFQAEKVTYTLHSFIHSSVDTCVTIGLKGKTFLYDQHKSQPIRVVHSLVLKEWRGAPL